jgi:hypothetical protein
MYKNVSSMGKQVGVLILHNGRDIDVLFLSLMYEIIKKLRVALMKYNFTSHMHSRINYITP